MCAAFIPTVEYDLVRRVFVIVPVSTREPPPHDRQIGNFSIFQCLRFAIFQGPSWQNEDREGILFGVGFSYQLQYTIWIGGFVLWYQSVHMKPPPHDRKLRDILIFQYLRFAIFQGCSWQNEGRVRYFGWGIRVHTRRTRAISWVHTC